MKIDRVIALSGVAVAVVTLVLGIYLAKYSGWGLRDEFRAEVELGFQVGKNGDDHVSTIVIRNSGDLPLVNLRGKITPAAVPGPDVSVYFKPAPWHEPYFEWSSKPTELVFQWSVMNPGEKVEIPAIYHSREIPSWFFWIKSDGVTFVDEIACAGCSARHVTRDLRAANAGDY